MGSSSRVDALDRALVEAGRWAASELAYSVDDPRTHAMALHGLSCAAFEILSPSGSPVAPASLRLFEGAAPLPARAAGRTELLDALSESSPHGLEAADRLGMVHEALLGRQLVVRRGRVVSIPARRRKRTGSFYTPAHLAREAVARALGLPHLSARTDLLVCDPAAGGGAFLLEAARQLSRRATAGASRASVREVVERSLFGADVSALAIAVCEAALVLLCGDDPPRVAELRAHLRRGDAIVGADAEDVANWTASGLVRSATRDELDRAVVTAMAGTEDPAPGSDDRALPLHWPLDYPEVFRRGGFDLVLGNPPWVAYAGRAAQPLSPKLRAHYARRFRAFRGYPTLHGLFVERASRLAPRGVVALVLPSPIADLDGYSATRRALTRRHVPVEPMLEFGQDAFQSVLQPSFLLLAEPCEETATREPTGATWRLAERQRAAGAARALSVPAVLGRLLEGATLPREAFRELGFQSTGRVTRELFSRAQAADARHTYPLLEGRNVREFFEDEPRLFLALDRSVLEAARCRVRPREQYEAVSFVVRQTASHPIAALHRGPPFRNSLLAGFAVADLSAPLLVALLNSVLYRALHLARVRDARQATFPQMKIAHLRALPVPPRHPELRAGIAELGLRATERGFDADLAQALDSAVFDLFSVGRQDRADVLAFVAERAPAAMRRTGA